MTKISWISLFIMLSAIRRTCSVKIQDLEFDDYHNWLQNDRRIIMMKKLPKNANYTWEEYYQSWNLNYDQEMTKKELSFATVAYIEEKLNSLQPLNFKGILVILDVSLESCENDYEMKTYDMKLSSENKFDRIDWSATYCGSKIVQKWCSTGNRLQITMAANHTIGSVKICANVTFTCPFSLFHFVADLIIVETRTSWKFTQLFIITIVAICIVGIVSFIVFGVVACELHHRKISRMAQDLASYRYTYSEDNVSFGIPDNENNVESRQNLESSTDETAPPPAVDT